MKRNSGSALTSVIVVFLLVTMIAVPLLGMVVYNYQLREYDSGTKEAEYKNEVIMDRIATIIKNDVIAAISEAKDESSADITTITDILVNSYNSVYDDAYDDANDYVMNEIAQYDENGKVTNADEVESAIKTNTENNIKTDLGDMLGIFEGVGTDSILEILDFEGDISNAKINDEKLQQVCNSIFQAKYQNILLNGTEENSYTNIFDEIYEVKCDDLANNSLYGDVELIRDDTTNKTLESTIRIKSKYTRDGNDFSYVYDKSSKYNGHVASFDANGVLEIGIENNYKLNVRVPLTTLSATFVIGTPEFSSISAIEQQTIALSNPVLDYGVIVGKTLKLNSDVKVDGNVLALANGIEIEKDADGYPLKDDNGLDKVKNDKGIVINSGASFEAVKVGISGLTTGEGRIATPGDIIMDTNTSLKTGTDPIYYRNLYLGDPNNKKTSGTIDVKFNGDVLAKDDLEINLDSEVTVAQAANKTYFGYNDTNTGGPDASSAIVINSSVLNNISIQLENLYLAGRAFVEGVNSVNRVDDYNNKMIYKTGESISVKGNYTAYQTPLFDTTNNKYDVMNVEFSPYFMAGEKEGFSTNLAMNLVDIFSVAPNGDDSAGPISEEDNSDQREAKYQAFDRQNKWEYFKEYAAKNTIKKPAINISNIKYMTGSGINGASVVGKKDSNTEQSIMIAKGDRFEEFTEFFGYYPEDEAKRKSGIGEWIKFSSTEKKVQNDSFFTYISKANAGNKTLAWGTSSTGANIDIVVPNNTSEIKGIIIHDGDLTITANCNSDIIFNGLIIVTGNLTINSDALTIISDKEAISDLIIQNYLGTEGYFGTMASGTLNVGDLFNSFEYDDSGTTYVAINVSPRSNMIDINELVGIKDWKKQGYGRL